MKFIGSCVIIQFFFNIQVVSSNSCFDDLVCIPSEYNKLVRPPPKNKTNDVFVEFKKIQISNINENENTITLKLTITMVWLEPRLFISANATEEEKNNLKSTIFLPKKFMNRLWLPDAYIPDVQKINKYNFIHDFEVYFYTLRKSGENSLGCKIEVETVLFCEMKFEAYPMDENTCYFTLGTYAPHYLSLQDFKLNQKRSSGVRFNASRQVSQLDFTIDVKEGLPKHKEKPNHGRYQRTGFEINFRRKVKRYITSYYIPSAILVVLSWVSHLNSSSSL